MGKDTSDSFNIVVYYCYYWNGRLSTISNVTATTATTGMEGVSTISNVN